MEQNPKNLPENPTDKLVVDALEKQDKPLTEQQQIFKVFQDTLNQFISKVHNFEGSKTQLQRVLINLAISPLNNEELHHGYPDEKELFDLGTSVNSSKFFLMVSGMAEQGKIAFLEDVKTPLASSEEEQIESSTVQVNEGE